LRRNETRLDAVLEASPEGILVLVETAEGPVVHLTNRAFCDLFRLVSRDILGVSEGDLLRTLNLHGVTGRSVASILASSNLHPVREQVAQGDGQEPQLEVTVTPLRDRRGRILGRMLTCQDLSQVSSHVASHDFNDLRATVQELDNANLTMKQNMVELEQYNTELLKLDEMKSRLLGNVSHELQTPLVSIRGYTEMILKGRLGNITDEQKKGLTLSLRNIDRLIAMIDGLLNLSRDERLHLTTFQLRGLVEECRDLIRPRLAAKEIQLTIHLDDPDVKIHGDREKLFQVFVNLLNNAIKYNKEGGRIEISTRGGKPGLTQIAIKDTGVGIAPEAQKNIFDRFYRADTGERSTGGEGGSGIGLSIVKNILRLHGCTIHVESALEEGSTFTFTLPLESGPEPVVISSRLVRNVPPGKPAPEDTPPESKGPRKDPEPRLRIIRPMDPHR
jgi:PAS domain S-box-containing protein